jgi:tetratricopeptide (TPR) repeat protein
MAIEPTLSVPRQPDITGPLVGRDDELRVLRSGLESARENRGVFVLLTGDPGIGKTRLVREIAAEAVGSGFAVEWGSGYEGRRIPCLWPWLKILRSQGIHYPPSESNILIEHRFPETYAGASAKEGETQEEGAESSDFVWLEHFEKIAISLKEAACRKSLLLILDDLHGTDWASLELLRFLCRELPDSAIMLVAIARDCGIKRSNFLRDLLPDLVHYGTHLAMSGLGAGAISRVVEVTTGAKPDADDVSSMIDATAGNPFLLLELLKLRTLSTPCNSPRFPNALIATINCLLKSLSPHCLEMLRVASAIGRQFDFRILQKTLNSETDELLYFLDEAVEVHVLREAAELPGHYQFVHGMVHDALHQQMNRSELLRLHNRIAEVLLDVVGEYRQAHLGEVAAHYLKGDAPEKALEYSEKAAARATLHFEFGEAVRFYAMAIKAFDLSANPDAAHRCDLLIEMAAAQSRAGDHKQAGLRFCEAAHSAEQRGDWEGVARAIVDQPMHCPAMLRLINRETVRLLRAVLSRLDSASPLAMRVRARLGLELWLDTGSRLEGEAMIAEAIEAARSNGDHGTLLAALQANDLVLSDPDLISDRIENATAIIDLAVQLRDYRAICLGSLAKITSFHILGGTNHGDSVACMMIQASETAREPLLRWAVLGHLACKNLREARFEQGREYIQECLALANTAGDDDIADLICPALIAVPSNERLGELYNLALAGYQRRPHLPLYGALLACIYCEQGRLDEAKLYFEKLTASEFSNLRRDGLYLPTLTLLAELSIRLNDHQRATELYELLLPFKNLRIMLGPASQLGPISYYLARLADVLTRPEVAQEHYSDAIRLSRQSGAVYWAALAEYEFCRVILQRDRYSETANELLESVIVTARNCGMAKLEQDANKLRLSLQNCILGSVLSTNGLATVSVEGLIKQIHKEPDSSDKNHTPAVFTNSDTTAANPYDDRIFRREGDYWTISYEGKTVRLQHVKGFGLIACLLSHPGRSFLAADLLTSAGEGTATNANGSSQSDTPVLDNQAKASYRERLQQLREELEEASSFNDEARISKLEEEIAFLTRELARALGIFSRDRKFPSDSERVRVRVTNSIRNAIKRLRAAHSALGRHLINSIKTGSFCSYTPEFSTEATWLS